ncbi:DoxX family protein [Microbacterium sp. R86528]|uniref:DoxX family protein n=1 Tax=Microbacterium sp. R86528 TaxID=3093864 RepID=UPI0037C6BD9B
MLIAYWIVAGLLALVYLAAGATKLFQPKEKLAASMPWTEDFSAAGVKAIGAVELLGAVGLILPAITGIAPILAPLAAVGLVVVQIVAIIVHVRRGETKALPVNIILAALAVAAAALGFAVWS